MNKAVNELRLVASTPHDWSQEHLAERADLNRSYLGEVERGNAVPSLITVSKLAGAFEIRLSSLIARCEHI